MYYLPILFLSFALAIAIAAFARERKLRQTLQALLLRLGKQNRTFVVILAPLVLIPPELEKQFLVLEHELPGREQLLTIAQFRAAIQIRSARSAPCQAVLFLRPIAGRHVS